MLTLQESFTFVESYIILFAAASQDTADLNAQALVIKNMTTKHKLETTLRKATKVNDAMEMRRCRAPATSMSRRSAAVLRTLRRMRADRDRQPDRAPPPEAVPFRPPADLDFRPPEPESCGRWTGSGPSAPRYPRQSRFQ